MMHSQQNVKFCSCSFGIMQKSTWTQHWPIWTQFPFTKAIPCAHLCSSRTALPIHRCICTGESPNKICPVIPQQSLIGPRCPVRLRPRIFLKFGTTRVVGRQPYASTAFTPGEIPVIHFQGLSRPQGTWFRRREPRKKNPQWHHRESIPRRSD